MIDTCKKCGGKQEWHYGLDYDMPKIHQGCGGKFVTTDVGCIEVPETAESRAAMDRLRSWGREVKDPESGMHYTEIRIPFSKKKPADFVPEWSVRKKKS